METLGVQLRSPKASLRPGFSCWGRGVHSEPCVRRQAHAWVSFPCEMRWLESSVTGAEKQLLLLSPVQVPLTGFWGHQRCVHGVWDGLAKSTQVLWQTLPTGCAFTRSGRLCVERACSLVFSRGTGWGVFLFGFFLSLWILTWQLCSKSRSLLQELIDLWG